MICIAYKGGKRSGYIDAESYETAARESGLRGKVTVYDCSGIDTKTVKTEDVDLSSLPQLEFDISGR